MTDTCRFCGKPYMRNYTDVAGCDRIRQRSVCAESAINNLTAENARLLAQLEALCTRDPVLRRPPEPPTAAISSAASTLRMAIMGSMLNYEDDRKTLLDAAALLEKWALSRWGSALRARLTLGTPAPIHAHQQTGRRIRISIAPVEFRVALL